MEYHSKRHGCFGVDASHIPPHSDALFDIVIENQTPYRESAAFGLIVVADDAYSGMERE